MKNLIVALFVAFTFTTPKDFCIQDFLANARTAGILLMKANPDEVVHGHISFSGNKLNVTVHDGITNRTEIENIINNSINAVPYADRLKAIAEAEKATLEAKQAIADNDGLSEKERIEALLEMIKILMNR